MATSVSDLQVEVNNDQVGIVPNSLTFTEGLGEQSIRAVSEGNGKVSQIFANDLTTNFATISFRIYPTSDNISLAREWKENGNSNSINLSGSGVRKSFGQCALTMDYTVDISADGEIDIEFKGNAAIG